MSSSGESRAQMDKLGFSAGGLVWTTDQSAQGYRKSKSSFRDGDEGVETLRIPNTGVSKAVVSTFRVVRNADCWK